MREIETAWNLNAVLVKELEKKKKKKDEFLKISGFYYFIPWNQGFFAVSSEPRFMLPT